MPTKARESHWTYQTQVPGAVDALATFRETRPAFAAQIASVWMDVDTVDLFRESCDCAILLGAGKFGENTHCVKLFDEWLIAGARTARIPRKPDAAADVSGQTLQRIAPKRAAGDPAAIRQPFAVRFIRSAGDRARSSRPKRRRRMSSGAPRYTARHEFRPVPLHLTVNIPAWIPCARPASAPHHQPSNEYSPSIIQIPTAINK
ncbi:hypothetical protein [Burkholderia diffusa]|uniref:hypothetical protein n=1 Tax=Burkholderia diffusa TaxID=488732 RepID=UPI0020C600AB|nr:hypothetical protein [Burkholderia diffusa]